MEVTAHDAFMAMYYALEAATDEYRDNGLKTLVEDSNPFVWKDHLSADPAVWADFSTDWLARQSKERECYHAPLVEAFDSIATPQDWESALEEL